MHKFFQENLVPNVAVINLLDDEESKSVAKNDNKEDFPPKLFYDGFNGM